MLLLVCLVVFAAVTAATYRAMNYSLEREAALHAAELAIGSDEDREFCAQEERRARLEACRNCGKRVGFMTSSCPICGCGVPALGAYRLNLSVQIGAIGALLLFVLVRFYWT